MKKIFLSALIVLAGLSSCNQSGPKEETSAPDPMATGVNMTVAQLASDKDLVCGMPVEDGGIADTASYEGKVYGFCASECKKAFLENPSQYLAQK